MHSSIRERSTNTRESVEIPYTNDLFAYVLKQVRKDGLVDVYTVRGAMRGISNHLLVITKINVKHGLGREDPKCVYMKIQGWKN